MYCGSQRPVTEHIRKVLSVLSGSELIRYWSALLGRMSVRFFLVSVRLGENSLDRLQVLMKGYVASLYIHFCAISETSKCFKIGGRPGIGDGDINTEMRRPSSCLRRIYNMVTTSESTISPLQNNLTI
jgi:hypothetical protein